ncbi:MAG: MATE family efflux transporter [Verrucomicrobiota bacterium]
MSDDINKEGADGAVDAAKRKGEYRTLVSMAMPMIVTQYCFALFQFFDAWMVGALGDEALAAVVPAGLMVFVPATFGIGYLAGVTTFVGQCFGRGAEGECRGYAWLGIGLGFVFGVIAAIALWPTAVPLFRLFGHEIAVFEYEVSYFRISLLAIAPQLVAIAITNFYLGIHRPRVAVVSAAVATALNIGLNYLLIFGKAGFPELGLSGAAWGTVLASLFQAAGLMIYFGLIGVGPAPASAEAGSGGSGERLRRLSRVGIPTGAQDVLEMMSWGVILVWLLGLFGTVHLAAGAILVRCMYLSFMPVEGIGAALSAIVAKSIGEGNEAGAVRQARTGTRVAVGFMLLMGILFFVFRRPIAGLFTQDEMVIQVAMAGFIWVAALQVFDGLHIVNAHCLQGAGDTLWASVVSLACSVVVLLGGGLLVVYLFPEWQSTGIWGVAAFYVALQGLLFWMRWRSGAWRRMTLFA